MCNKFLKTKTKGNMTIQVLKKLIIDYISKKNFFF